MKCGFCKKEFEVDKSKRNWQRVKFCSIRCRKDLSNKEKTDNYVSKQWPLEKKCLRCGSDFLIYSGGQQKYCGKECAKLVKAERSIEKFEKARTKNKCVVCGEMFMPVKYSGSHQKICSKKCKGIARQEKSRAIDGDRKRIRALFKKEFNENSAIAKKRDGYKCTQCGSEKKLHAHHRDNSGGTPESNNDVPNLITLCGTCHNMYHHLHLIYKDGKYAVEGIILDKLNLSFTLDTI